MPTTHGFELIQEKRIPELFESNAKYFRHKKTGAELVAFENKDENKGFAIGFRTPPEKPHGIAHILEHSVLCGSKKYPIHHPFIELVKSSLKTFINAFTFPDKTVYPFTSPHIQDFYNLMDVYLDSVFHPLLLEDTLKQEGWHLHLENLEDPLIYKGVVYNEMKGQYSSPEARLAEHTLQTVFKGHLYSINAGGDPYQIPELTYKEFVEFHKRYYHPTNSIIYLYGDSPTEENLRRLDAVISEFERGEPPAEIPLTKGNASPQKAEFFYDPGENTDLSKKGMMTVSWLLPEAGKIEPRLELSILTHILIGTPASPLRKALIDSGLGEDLVGVGIDTMEVRQMYFSTGLKGINIKDAQKVEDLILSTLKELHSKGIDKGAIEASLNTIEFALRERNTGSFPRAVSIIFDLYTSSLYGGDPFSPLSFETPLNSIKTKVKFGEKFFESLIEKYFLQNNSRTTVLLTPKPGYFEEEERIERERLAVLRSKMSKEELQTVLKATQDLKVVQDRPDSPENLAKLPSLALSDLNKKITTIPLTESSKDGATVLYHDLDTNKIVYLDVCLNIHTLPEHLLPLIPLFSRGLLEMGTKSEDFVRFLQRIGQKTGGVSQGTISTLPSGGGSESRSWFVLRAKAMTSQIDDLLAVLKDILLSAKLDNRERFKQMVLDEKASIEAGISSSGDGVALLRLSASFDETGWLVEKFAGVGHLFFLRDLATRIDEDWAGVLKDLEEIRNIIVTNKNIIVNATVDGKSWNGIEPKIQSFIASLPSTKTEHRKWKFSLTNESEAIVVPSQVNYIVKAASTYSLGYTYHGSAQVIARFLSLGWLWDKVRMQGGAYGGYCRFDYHSGIFAYMSYRDPNVVKTIDTYDKTAQYLKNCNPSNDELRKTIIGMIGEMDRYQLPDSKGYTSMVRWISGMTDEIRQKFRDEVLSTTVADFHRFAEVLESFNKKALVGAVGSPSAIEEANKERKIFTKITKVL